MAAAASPAPTPKSGFSFAAFAAEMKAKEKFTTATATTNSTLARKLRQQGVMAKLRVAPHSTTTTGAAITTNDVAALQKKVEAQRDSLARLRRGAITDLARRRRQQRIRDAALRTYLLHRYLRRIQGKRALLAAGMNRWRRCVAEERASAVLWHCARGPHVDTDEAEVEARQAEEFLRMTLQSKVLISSINAPVLSRLRAAWARWHEHMGQTAVAEHAEEVRTFKAARARESHEREVAAMQQAFHVSRGELESAQAAQLARLEIEVMTLKASHDERVKALKLSCAAAIRDALSARAAAEGSGNGGGASPGGGGSASAGKDPRRRRSRRAKGKTAAQVLGASFIAEHMHEISAKQRRRVARLTAEVATLRRQVKHLRRRAEDEAHRADRVVAAAKDGGEAARKLAIIGDLLGDEVGGTVEGGQSRSMAPQVAEARLAVIRDVVLGDKSKWLAYEFAGPAPKAIVGGEATAAASTSGAEGKKRPPRLRQERQSRSDDEAREKEEEEENQTSKTGAFRRHIRHRRNETSSNCSRTSINSQDTVGTMGEVRTPRTTAPPNKTPADERGSDVDTLMIHRSADGDRAAGSGVPAAPVSSASSSEQRAPLVRINMPCTVPKGDLASPPSRSPSPPSSSSPTPSPGAVAARAARKARRERERQAAAERKANKAKLRMERAQSRRRLQEEQQQHDQQTTLPPSSPRRRPPPPSQAMRPSAASATRVGRVGRGLKGAGAAPASAATLRSPPRPPPARRP